MNSILAFPRKSAYATLKLYLKRKNPALCHIITGILTSTFLKPVNGSKKSILNWVMKLNAFMCAIFFLQNPWKSFHSNHWFFLLLELQTTYKLYFCNQMECWQYIFRQSGDFNLKNVSFHRYWPKHTVKKVKLWGKMIVEKSD